jgi:hypothetical protein
MRIPSLLALLLPLLRAPALDAQQPPAQAGPGASAVRPTLRAGAAAGIRVDGRLDEPAWGTAGVADGFVQQLPSPGAAETERTEARVVYDATAVYVGMRMHDPRPDSISSQLSPRDQPNDASDWARVYVDSYADRRTAFVFWLNPSGVKVDWMRFDDASGVDLGWNAVWEGSATVDSAGWTAEFRIPLSQLRYSARAAATGGAWGINFSRVIARRNETTFWADIPFNGGAFVSRFGDLTGLAGLRSPARVEVLPYTSVRLTRAPGDAADPFFRPNSFAGSSGADVKVGVTSDLTLSATLNPDFGQVEADPAEVNLSAFETFFPERRPFFSEGAQIFRFGQLDAATQGSSQFFYSRRIGRAPAGRVRVENAAYTEVPEQSTILGAVKLSGRTRSGWSVGVLDAVTAPEEGRYRTVDGASGRYPVEPLSNFFVGRVRRDLQNGRLVLGALATATHRDLSGGAFDDLLRGRAYVAGADGSYAWGGGAWSLGGYAAFSRTEGGSAVIAAAQRSSARYFQRPDAPHLSLDPGRTSLGGFTAALGLRRTGSLGGSVAYEVTSPGFEINDLGYLSTADRHAVTAEATHMLTGGRGLVQRTYSAAGAKAGWNFAGDRVLTRLYATSEAAFRTRGYAGAYVGYGPGSLDDRLTRGGPLARQPWEAGTDLWAGTDPRRPVSLRGYVGSWWYGGGGRSSAAQVSLTGRPTAAVQASVQPSVSRERNTQQFLAALADPASTTFGHRYVFGTADQTTFALDTRLDWVVTPTLSLRYYARPFVAAARFSGVKELAAPGTMSFRRFGVDAGTVEAGMCGEGAEAYACRRVDPDGPGPAAEFAIPDPDFTVRSVRGSAVVRWEYRPGSTVYLVWQQDRAGEDPFGTFAPRRDLPELLRDPSRNVFLLKFTYWFSR